MIIGSVDKTAETQGNYALKNFMVSFKISLLGG